METVMSVVVGMLFTCGTVLLLKRSLLQVIVGLCLLSHGANLSLIIAGGLKRGGPPILGVGAGPPFTDPLPQALVLTAIVISFGMTAFALVLAYRTRQECDTDNLDELQGGEE